jgi:hypothetical protein
MKTVTRLLAVLATAVLVLFAACATASAQEAAPPEGGYVHEWSIGPAGSTDPSQPGNRSNLTYDAAPGSIINDAVIISNFGNVQLNFRIYATDAINTPDGEIDLLDGDEVPTDAGSWVQVAQENVTIPPGMELTLPVTITVPSDARSGDHVAGIVASSPAPGRGADGAAFTLDRRTSTRLNLRVAGPLEPRLEVQSLGVSYSPTLNPLSGDATVTYRIQNTGNVRAEGEYRVTASGPFGLKESTSETFDVPELLPGQGYEVTTTLSGVPAAFVANAAVHVTPEPISGDTQAAEASSAETRTFAIPFTLIALAVVLALVLFAVRRFRTHGGDGGAGRGPGSTGPGGGPDRGKAIRPPRAGLPSGEPVLEGQRS